MIDYKSYKPKFIRLDACSRCQLDCVCCDSRKIYDAKPLNETYLHFDDFQKFIVNNPYIELIELSNNGEIFLNPDLIKIIEFAYKKNVRLIAYNGVNMNYAPENILEAMVKFQFRGLTVSIDGASQETYSIYRRNGNFDNVIQNVKKLNFYKNKYNSIYPKLKFQFILFGHNIHELEKAKELAESLNMEFYTKQNSNKDYSPILSLDMVNDNEVKEELTRDEIQNKYLGTCNQLWFEPQIDCDGSFLGCCCRFKSFENTNVFKDGFENVLKSQEVVNSKKLLMGQDSQEYSYCLNCDFFKLRKKHNLWITDEMLSHVEKHITTQIDNNFDNWNQ